MQAALEVLNTNSLMDDFVILKEWGYTLGRQLGEGSYAKVKSAYSKRLQRNIAVKIIDRKKAPTDFLERFLPREIAILSKLDHQSVVKTYEVIEHKSGKVYIIMELAAQGDLLEFIKSRGAITEEVARKLFHQLAKAVKYCHDLDIVHRDLKCENILLDKDFNIKLSDFGFGKIVNRDEAGKIVLSKTFCGSAAYAAPEILQGIPYNPKVYDVWSLGIILFIMVSGSMPFKDSNIKKMLHLQKEHKVIFPRYKRLSSSCKDLICRILQPDVSRRLTINEILNHTWFAGATRHQVPENDSGEDEQASVLQRETANTKKQPDNGAANFQGENLQQEQASTSINKAYTLNNSELDA